MAASSELRNQIEFALSSRIPSALSPRVKTELTRIASGIGPMDQLLSGGLPVGVITELIGVEGSGRTSTALAYVAANTRASNVCAWIDATDALDPETAAANGVDLERLLWVRCSQPISPASHIPWMLAQATSDSASLLASLRPRHTGGGSPHPRSEGRDMPQAISLMLHAHGGSYDMQTRREKKAIGTPGAPNRPLSQSSEYREEQINSDRLPPRRGDNLVLAPRCAEPQPRRQAALPSGRQRAKSLIANKQQRHANSPWKVLDHALRATDLLLQTGGFSAIVLDLGSVQPEIALRIPLATWFRFRAACERSQISLILLSQHSCARSSAALVVHLQPGQMEARNKVMTGIRYRAATERNRSRESSARVIPIRKSPQSERSGDWRSDVAWAQMR